MSTLPYKIVAFYTQDTPYENEIINLRASLDKLGIGDMLYTKGYPSRGEWAKNCAIKPEFIRHCLTTKECGGKDLLYVDADATFERIPEDIFQEGIFWYYKFKNKEALSGTLYIKNCPRMLQFLQEWIDLQNHHPTVFDQDIMGRIIKRHPGWNFKILPPQYIKIFDLMRKVPNPVIVHHQASRKFKEPNSGIRANSKGVNMSDFVLPDKVRILADGTYCLIRRNKRIEDYMDAHLSRFGNERRWYPHMEGSDVAVFKNLFQGQTAHIIGKGPSLDALSAKDFTDETGPVLCLNEAIHVVEKLGLKNPLYVLQQDTHLKDTCVPSKATTKMLVSYMAQTCGRGFENRFIYKPVDLGMRDTSLTAQIAIGFCKIFGIKKIRFLCFDACVNKNTDYAKAVGYEPTRNGDPARFLRHRKILDDMSIKFKPEWVIPSHPQTPASSDDNTQQQGDNQ